MMDDMEPAEEEGGDPVRSPGLSANDIFYAERQFTTQEGVRLFVRDYGDAASRLTPVLCLPGLTRNSKDFVTLAEWLGTERRVVCPDLRGRGQSQFTGKIADYTPQLELGDILDLIAGLGLGRVLLVGTSRGGLIAMLMAALRPAALAGVILNDVGPEIERAGLERISESGTATPPKSWPEAVAHLRRANERKFPNVTTQQWIDFASRTYDDRDGTPALAYDPKIMEGLHAALAASQGPLPATWPLFGALAHLPLLVVRGENSDVLSQETFERMIAEHPGCHSVTATARGHVPFLDEKEVIAAIDNFLAMENL
ncbi:MAG: alpha/beta hydrolase [Parvibaculaceae bacterium]|nr:alpha/beta hydrolase [Parvibaculaceae bacterium]